ncbi:MAG: DUF554 domain-containing protein [Oscillospiraceae bacterium]|nr:DUF554 domain-containing protein [Oscillospiraceae bacterium]
MIMLGTIVNVAAILIGGAAGLILKKALSKRITDTVMQGVALAVVIIGISGALGAAFTVVGGKVSSDHIMFMIIALAVGALIGELIKIEDRLDAFAAFCESKFVKTAKLPTTSAPGSAQPPAASSGASPPAAQPPAPPFAQGFVTATLVFCVGSMAIVGSLEDGISRNSSTLFAKSALDGITAMIFASTMGFGVLFSAASVGVYQGLITLLAIFVAPYFSDVVITQISLIGSVLIMSIGFNMLRIAKIKVGNLLPAIFIPIIYHAIAQFFGFAG